MRYFSDEKIAQMKDDIMNNSSSQNKSMYLAYLSRIEMLDKRNDQYGDCREELMKAISQLQSLSEGYIHRGKADPNDEDNDAFEYENYESLINDIKSPKKFPAIIVFYFQPWDEDHYDEYNYVYIYKDSFDTMKRFKFVYHNPFNIIVK